VSNKVTTSQAKTQTLLLKYHKTKIIILAGLLEKRVLLNYSVILYSVTFEVQVNLFGCHKIFCPI